MEVSELKSVTMIRRLKIVFCSFLTLPSISWYTSVTRQITVAIMKNVDS